MFYWNYSDEHMAERKLNKIVKFFKFNIMKEKIIEILKSNSDSLVIEQEGSKSTLTFIGSINYHTVADKLLELIKPE